jgi:hypothetical protein
MHGRLVRDGNQRDEKGAREKPRRDVTPVSPAVSRDWCPHHPLPGKCRVEYLRAIVGFFYNRASMSEFRQLRSKNYFRARAVRIVASTAIGILQNRMHVLRAAMIRVCACARDFARASSRVRSVDVH